MLLLRHALTLLSGFSTVEISVDVVEVKILVLKKESSLGGPCGGQWRKESDLGVWSRSGLLSC